MQIQSSRAYENYKIKNTVNSLTTPLHAIHFSAASKDTFQRQSLPLFGAKNALHKAIEDNKYAQIVSLSTSSPNFLEEKDENGLTPLLQAASQDDAHAVNLLLQNGANITATDSDGQNVLHLAAISGAGSIDGGMSGGHALQLLLKKPNCPSVDSTNGYSETVFTTLLHLGLDPDATNEIMALLQTARGH